METTEAAAEGRPKVFVANVGRYVMNKKLKRLFLKHGIPFATTHKHTRAEHGIVAFNSEEEKEKAKAMMSKLANKAGEKYTVQDYVPNIVSITKSDGADGTDVPSKKRKKADRADVGAAVADDAKQEEAEILSASDAVAPWRKISYEEQLRQKQLAMAAIMRRLTRRIVKAESRSSSSHPEWVDELRTGPKEELSTDGYAAFDEAKKRGYGKVPGAACPIDKIAPSPLVNGYRNKCEFTIGAGTDGKPTVGFRVSSFSKGSIEVSLPEENSTVPNEALACAKKMQEIVRSSPLPFYDIVKHKGFWRSLLVRFFESTRSIMCSVAINDEELEKSVIDAELQRVVKEFTGKDTSFLGGVVVKSIEVVRFSRASKPADLEGETLFGEPYIVDQIDGISFKVSSSAFFQVNSFCAEVLFQKIRELTQSGSACKNQDSAKVKPTILDVCCGTGTIGLSMAKAAKKVIGVDISEKAINDARMNAEANCIENAIFVAAPIEEVIVDVTKGQHVVGKHDTESYKPPPYTREAHEAFKEAGQVVAILDPPRAGVHRRVIREMRTSNLIKRLVYVACNPDAALENFVQLCREEHKNRPGQPFRPLRAIPVDMFPNTAHCELVVLFEKKEK